VKKMKNNLNQWIAGILSGFALVLFLTACESKKTDSSQAPGEQPKSSMATGQSERNEGATSAAPETEKAQPGAGKQEKPGRAG
jgi:hypothetical protein